MTNTPRSFFSLYISLQIDGETGISAWETTAVGMGPVPVTVLTGYVGSGKTTLILRYPEH